MFVFDIVHATQQWACVLRPQLADRKIISEIRELITPIHQHMGPSCNCHFSMIVFDVVYVTDGGRGHVHLRIELFGFKWTNSGQLQYTFDVSHTCNFKWKHVNFIHVLQMQHNWNQTQLDPGVWILDMPSSKRHNSLQDTPILEQL